MSAHFQSAGYALAVSNGSMAATVREVASIADKRQAESALQALVAGIRQAVRGNRAFAASAAARWTRAVHAERYKSGNPSFYTWDGYSPGIDKALNIVWRQTCRPFVEQPQPASTPLSNLTDAALQELVILAAQEQLRRAAA